MAKIHIDNTTPCSVAHLIDKRDEVILQHGGVCTRFLYDTVEQMDLNTFVKLEAPKMKPDKDSLMVIRNPLAGQSFLILDDQVLKYHLTNIEECTVASIDKFIKNDSAVHLVLNSLYPVVSYSVKQNNIIFIVKIDAHKRYYSNSYAGINTSIYMPPVWFKVVLSSVYNLVAAYIVVVLESNVDVYSTKLYKWPLGNASGANGKICFGMTYVQGGAETSDDVMSVTQHTVNRFFDSTSNGDLITYSDTYKSTINKLYREYADTKKYDKKIRSRGLQSDESNVVLLIKTIAVLENPNGWKAIKYDRADTKVEAFINSEEGDTHA